MSYISCIEAGPTEVSECQETHDFCRPSKRRALDSGPSKTTDGLTASADCTPAGHRPHALLEDFKRKYPDSATAAQVQPKRVRRRQSKGCIHQRGSYCAETDSVLLFRKNLFKKFDCGSSYDGDWLPSRDGHLSCKAGHVLLKSTGNTSVTYICDYCQTEGLCGARLACTVGECNFNLCDRCASNSVQMGKMDGFGIFSWADGSRFEGKFCMDFPVSGQFFETTGEVYSVRYAGDKSLLSAAEPVFKRLSAVRIPTSGHIGKVVALPRLLETSPVDAYTGLHSGLMGNQALISGVIGALHSSSAAIHDVVYPFLNQSHMHAFFLSEQGVLNREVKSAKDQLAKMLSKSKKVQFPLSIIGAASETLAKINLDQTPTHMDLLLELLCSLVVCDPNGAAAQMALGRLQRFLLPLQSLGAHLCLADTVNGAASFTDRHLDRYMGMVEQLFVRGSPATREMAADCLLGIATARGGLRHLSRVATFLQNSGCHISLAATASVDRLLQGVDCILDSDVAWACADNGLNGMLAGAWFKCVPQGQKAAAQGTVCGLKVLVLSLVRLLANRCVEHISPPHTPSFLSIRPSLRPSLPPSAIPASCHQENPSRTRGGGRVWGCQMLSGAWEACVGGSFWESCLFGGSGMAGASGDAVWWRERGMEERGGEGAKERGVD
jgi:hypothetical protein